MSCLVVESESETTWFAKALREDLFETWFQPIVDTSGGDPHLLGNDCSLRLFDGRLHGDAEIREAARIHDDFMFDEYARRAAISAAASQPGNGPWFINFAPASIRIPEFCPTGMRPRDIVFEAAESDLASDPDRSGEIRDFMRNCGFGFAVDDAGTRADSLRTICDLRPDYIKLDKSLVRSIERPVHAATIRTLVEIGDRTGAAVIAKGVDRTRTMENLWLLGVRYMQGYLFGSPKPGG
jgi:EAL domain-containing protein (putative c-di-GMP-specific phosphodiesterase class I)